MLKNNILFLKIQRKVEMLDESHETSVQHVQLLIEEEIGNDKCIPHTFFFILSIFLWIINMSGNIISTD